MRWSCSHEATTLLGQCFQPRAFQKQMSKQPSGLDSITAGDVLSALCNLVTFREVGGLLPSPAHLLIVMVFNCCASQLGKVPSHSKLQRRGGRQPAHKGLCTQQQNRPGSQSHRCPMALFPLSYHPDLGVTEVSRNGSW